MTTEIQKYFTSSLRSELSSVVKVTSISSSFLVTLYLFMLISIHCQMGYSLYLGSFLFLTQMLRYYLSLNTDYSDKAWLDYFTTLMVINSVAWFFLLCHIILKNIGNSEVVILSFMVVTGLIASNAYTMSISKRDFVAFQVCLLSTGIIGFQVNSSQWIYQVGGTLMTIVFFVFLLKQRDIQEKLWKAKILHNFELQKIIDTIPGGISVVRDGVYIRANEYLKNHILKMKSTENLVGVRLGDLTSRDSDFVKSINDFSTSNKNQIKYETTIEVNSESRHHLVVAHNIFNEDSVDTIISTIDIQDLKIREIENNINLAKLEHSSKMAALGEMSSGLAHEINNPLAIITGRIQILKKQAETQSIEIDSLIKAVDIIEKTTFRIAKIVKGLKTFARDADNDDFAQGRMSDLIDDTLSFCEARFKNFGVTFKHDNEAVKGFLIECRLTQLSQVLLNALNNSYDAISNLDEKWIELAIEKINGKYIFRITDSGKGIPLHVRSKLMQPFFTTKEVGKGTGLGLSLSKSIVDSHQGRIYFNFDHPTNTQLVIEIPEFQSNKKAA